MIKNFYTFIFSFFATFLLLSVSSCSDVSISPDNVVLEDSYNLRLSLNSAIQTRSSGEDLDEEFIGQPTFSLFYDGRFLMDLKNYIHPLPEKNKYETSINISALSGAFKQLDITFSDELLSEPKFQILTTANRETYDASSKTMFDGSLNDLWKNSSDYNFKYKTATSNVSWIPNAGNEAGIPMFGMSAEFKFKGQNEDIDVPMLRALAKLEVFDVMKMPDESYPFTIKDVTLSKCAGTGRLVPDISKNADWNKANIQVTAPSLPSSLSYNISNLILVKSSETLNIDNEEVACDKWICYIPEMDLSDEDLKDVIININLNEAEIPAKVSLYSELSEKLRTKYVLRNNDYRFFVTGLRESETGFKVIIDTDPFGDINFINLNGNKWWLHKEYIDETEFEVWYKLVYNLEPNAARRAHWEKEWYSNEDGIWFKWTGLEWEPQDSASQGPYQQVLQGINTNTEFNEINNKFLSLDNYDQVGVEAANLFKKFGKILEIGGQPMKCFMLNTDVMVENSYHVLPMHKDYVLYGNGHTVYMEIYGGPTRYNLGPVRDIYIERPDNLSPSFRIYIDLQGNVINEDGNTLGTMTPLEDNNRSYNINFDGNNIGVIQDRHFNSTLNK